MNGTVVSVEIILFLLWDSCSCRGLYPIATAYKCIILPL